MSAWEPDPTVRVLERVAGLEASYHCPDAAAIERHIAANRARLAKADVHAPITASRLRHDVDLLLDRWLYLHEMA